MSSKRIKTKYLGVIYIEGRDRIASKPDRIYYIRWRDRNNQLHEKKAGRKSEGMTPLKASLKRQELMNGGAVFSINNKGKGETLTMDLLWNLYVQGHLDSKSIRRERSRFKKHISIFFGNRKPESIVEEDWEQFRKRLKKQGLSEASIYNILEIFRRTVNYGIKKKKTKGFNFVPEIKEKKPILREYLTYEQIERLKKEWKKTPHRLEAEVMETAFLTGWRLGDIRRLKWKHINFDNGTVTLVDPKGGTPLYFPLGKKMLKMLRKKKEALEEKNVFVSKRGGFWRTRFYEKCRAILDAARIPNTFRPFHGLRHTFATLLANSGEVDRKTLQRAMGHKDERMTERYAHILDKTLRKAIEVMDKIS